MLEIDRHLTQYQFSEKHTIKIEASIDRVRSAVKSLDFSKSFIIRNLFRLRGMNQYQGDLLTFAKLNHFRIIEDKENELLLGLWILNKSYTPMEGKDKVLTNDTFVIIKIYWNFSIEKLNDINCLLTTETRIYCLTKTAQMLFSIYWFFIFPFSSWIRRLSLRIIKLNAET